MQPIFYWIWVRIWSCGAVYKLYMAEKGVRGALRFWIKERVNELAYIRIWSFGVETSTWQKEV
jgi:hypothetical protein